MGEGIKGERETEFERQNENLKQAACSAHSLTQGLIPQPWDHDLSGNQELDTQPTESPRCHGIDTYPVKQALISPFPR